MATSDGEREEHRAWTHDSLELTLPTKCCIDPYMYWGLYQFFPGHFL